MWPHLPTTPPLWYTDRPLYTGLSSLTCCCANPKHHTPGQTCKVCEKVWTASSATLSLLPHKPTGMEQPNPHCHSLYESSHFLHLVSHLFHTYAPH
mmetsp:Transcript_31419/g.69978  ORF Transcript_31419/g.69978 Transcript_31419/m.69978 type:complete len:96 (-) Transcript_31419:653-940(-)